ncbi:HlyD family secretion protein [Rubripirellula lacrimiformis]|uniref:HlyD family secretion protein n=1 Tax=Rubripirellula lacrimiformis TaxID=1930273 RepID=A0A517NBS9_9BACT|nr:efflux RND transporter periplasmic adaptor subunit [Rubripirellula lacrimiformis]QDT04580.1 HlyD family secretion protein [Rubripirellula lacrimiformis]
MSSQNQAAAKFRSVALTVAAIAIAIVAGGYAFTDIPQRLGLASASQETGSEEPGHEGHDHAAGEHDDHAGHDHEGHDEAESIELSSQARANLKLTTQAVSVGRFDEYIEVPATVVDWPGRTHIAITSPLTGVIKAIEVSRGELISSGRPLFILRLTHQDLVETQEQFLTSLGQLDVEEREINRLTSISNSGAVAGKTRLAREYERDKLLAGLKAAKQSMLLHGLTDEQIQSIQDDRKLIREVTIYAPTLHSDRSLHHDSNLHSRTNIVGDSGVRFASMQPPPLHPEHIEAEFLITELNANRGESVQAGQQLGRLSDYSEILIQGEAYQRDGEALQKAANSEQPLQALIESRSGRPQVIEGLKIVYIGNEVNRESRSLPFYVSLTNQIERSERIDGQQYVSWRYKPGQRLQLRVPVSGFDNAIVVPKEAVAEEGPERYVFVENNNHFDRVAVEVLASDSMNVAIRNDGQLWPGQSIAVSGAHQLQMAMKNQSGGAIDPHAGHNH